MCIRDSSYSRAMLQELYANAGKIDTLFLGSSHCYRSVDPNAVDAALGTYIKRLIHLSSHLCVSIRLFLAY